MLPFAGGVLAAGALMLAGLFGFQGESNAAEPNPAAQWQQRGALCAEGPAASAADDELCALLAADVAP